MTTLRQFLDNINLREVYSQVTYRKLPYKDINKIWKMLLPFLHSIIKDRVFDEYAQIRGDKKYFNLDKLSLCKGGYYERICLLLNWLILRMSHFVPGYDEDILHDGTEYPLWIHNSRYADRTVYYITKDDIDNWDNIIQNKLPDLMGNNLVRASLVKTELKINYWKRKQSEISVNIQTEKDIFDKCVSNIAKLTVEQNVVNDQLKKLEYAYEQLKCNPKVSNCDKVKENYWISQLEK